MKLCSASARQGFPAKDGVITPAISVLSAIEGLKKASPRLEPVVLPLTCAILVALFAIQRRGTGSRIGRELAANQESHAADADRLRTP